MLTCVLQNYLSTQRRDLQFERVRTQSKSPLEWVQLTGSEIG